MSGRHTPGPWTADERDGRIGIWPAINREEQEAATFYGPFPVPGLGHHPSAPIARVDGILRGAPVSRELNDTDRANARLIAAAPDMLAELKKLYAYVGEKLSANRYRDGITGAEHALCDSAYSAIAKAEGR